MSLLHGPKYSIARGFVAATCRSDMSLQHVPATCPLVFENLEAQDKTSLNRCIKTNKNEGEVKSPVAKSPPRKERNRLHSRPTNSKCLDLGQGSPQGQLLSSNIINLNVFPNISCSMTSGKEQLW